jgi:uncharacterized protein (DUF169 family)
MSLGDKAEKISSALALSTPPVALAFVTEPPDGVPMTDRVVPSSCAFWRQAEQGVFYASAEQHFNCPVGAMVMGFELPASLQEQLGGLVGKMGECGYLSPDEAASIPSVGRGSAGIVYGPLAAFPMNPDVVLVWLTPVQAMLLSEAAGGASWSTPPATVTGRPACAALPLAMANDSTSLSLGCMGMRTFTEVADDRLLAAIPASRVDELVGRLEGTMAANEQMRSFYQEHKRQVLGVAG